MVREKYHHCPKMLRCYASLLAHYPQFVVSVVIVVVVTCLVVSVYQSDGFNFEQPRAGFETRGTDISRKLVSYENLQSVSETSLSLTPFRYQYENARLKYTIHHKSRKKNRKGKNRKKNRKNNRKRIKVQQHVMDISSNYFCDDLDEKYARIVFQSHDGSSLFTLDNIVTMCELERRVVRSTPFFEELCIDDSRECRSWSLGNYISLLSNKTSCQSLEEQDISQVLYTLKDCAEFYRNYSLGPYCYECKNIPEPCKEHNAVYHILHYLTDINFTNISQDKQPILKYSVSFLPISRNSATVKIFEHIENQYLIEDNVELIAANFGIKDILFKKYLWSDCIWLIITAVAIFTAIWLYSASFFITIMTFLAIFWSLEVAYFLYVVVFRINFFPYMNMVTIMIMVGIGADDVFIYCKLWNLAKSDRNNDSLVKIVFSTLRHATASMLVSSMTTAAAFWANSISDITAIRCFSIYVGTAVLCNFLLMITWMPAIIVLYEKSCSNFSCKKSSKDGFCHTLCQLPYSCYQSVSNSSRIFFKKILPYLVVKLRFFWLVFYGALGVASTMVVFFYPGIKLPTKEKFQYFSSNHLLEVYDLQLWNLFWFEEAEVSQFTLMPITIVWGVLAEDNGNPLDPYDHGTLKFDEAFHLESTEAQIWLMDFCSKLRQQPFYQYIPGYEITNCFFENFRNYMSTPCMDKYQRRQGCCNVTEFPYSPEMLIKCLGVYIPILMNTPYIGPYYSNYHLPGPRFENGRIRAFLVEFSSNIPFTNAYEKLHSFYTQVNDWVQEQICEAPDELGRGWFVSYLQFFDLQNSILHGLPIAMGLSIAVAAAVIFFTTLNVLLSIYAVITVTFTILTTVAILLLLGWELNILESVVITVAIGMSIDFTLHYGVAYRLSCDIDRESRVVCSISRMGSAIAMASLTTFLAGAIMLPATVLVYRQFGTFLMIIITTSWLYATFFFQSLLCVFGPSATFGQFYWSHLCCCFSSSKQNLSEDSENELSTSTTNTPLHRTDRNFELKELNSESKNFHPYFGAIAQPIQSQLKDPNVKQKLSPSKDHCNSTDCVPKQDLTEFPHVSGHSNNIRTSENYLQCDKKPLAVTSYSTYDKDTEVWIRRVDT